MTSEITSTKVIDPHSYGIVVRRIKSGEDYIYKGTVTELPDIATFEDSYEAAYELALDAIESLYEAANEEDRSFPLPYVQNEEQDFSGRVTLRMPKWLHSHLWNQANAEGVSLNLYMISVLSAASFIRTLVAQAVERIAETSATHNVYYSTIQGGLLMPIFRVAKISAESETLPGFLVTTQQGNYLTSRLQG